MCVCGKVARLVVVYSLKVLHIEPSSHLPICIGKHVDDIGNGQLHVQSIQSSVEVLDADSLATVSIEELVGLLERAELVLNGETDNLYFFDVVNSSCLLFFVWALVI